MRQATTNTHWLLSDTGQIEGLSCGADFTSEHESGISGIRDAFGFKARHENGLPDRVAQKLPPVLVLRELKGADGKPEAWLVMASHRYQGLFSFPEGSQPPEEPPFYREVQHSFSSPELRTAWDEDGVLIYASGEKSVGLLKQFHQMVQDKDLALGNAFTGSRSDWHSKAGGLVFVRASAIPQPLVDKALADDQSAVRLCQAAEKLGLDKELKAAGKRWFALSPRWANDQESEIKFWLNPYDQDSHHYGLFSVEELRQWARDEGPVMVDKPLRAEARKLGKDLSKLQQGIRKSKFEVPSLSVVWANEEKTEVGIKVHYYHPNSAKYPLVDQGVFSLQELQQRFLPMPARRKAPGPR